MNKTKTGPLPLKVEQQAGHYAVITNQGNFFAKTYNGRDAHLIAASPTGLKLALLIVAHASQCPDNIVNLAANLIAEAEAA